MSQWITVCKIEYILPETEGALIVQAHSGDLSSLPYY